MERLIEPVSSRGRIPASELLAEDDEVKVEAVIDRSSSSVIRKRKMEILREYRHQQFKLRRRQQMEEEEQHQRESLLRTMLRESDLSKYLVVAKDSTDNNVQMENYWMDPGTGGEQVREGS